MGKHQWLLSSASFISVWSCILFFISFRQCKRESIWRLGAVLKVHTKQSIMDRQTDALRVSERERERHAWFKAATVLKQLRSGTAGLFIQHVSVLYILTERQKCPSLSAGAKAELKQVRSDWQSQAINEKKDRALRKCGVSFTTTLQSGINSALSGSHWPWKIVQCNHFLVQRKWMQAEEVWKFPYFLTNSSALRLIKWGCPVLLWPFFYRRHFDLT